MKQVTSSIVEHKSLGEIIWQLYYPQNQISFNNITSKQLKPWIDGSWSCFRPSFYRHVPKNHGQMFKRADNLLGKTFVSLMWQITETLLKPGQFGTAKLPAKRILPEIRSTTVFWNGETGYVQILWYGPSLKKSNSKLDSWKIFCPWRCP